MLSTSRGDVLVSVLIGTVVVAILVLSVATLFSNMHEGVASASLQSSASGHIQAIRIALAGRFHCRVNFQNRPLPPIGSPMDLNQLFYALPDGSGPSADVIVGVGPVAENIEVTNIRWLIEKALSSQAYLGRVQIFFKRDVKVGPSQIIRSIPVVFSTSNGRVTDCLVAEDLLPKCDPTTQYVSGYGNVNLPEGRLTQMQILSKYCDCECRVNGWVCRCYDPPPPPPSSGSGSGVSGGDASADCASGDSGF